ncbi:MAG: hypothetical protein J6C46_01680 [Clostridia bacterium]|nr:hypothetical protein [Clostridia bacterium]
MSTKAKNNAKQNIIYIVLSISIIAIIYIIFQCILLFKKPTNSVLVKNGRLTNYEEVIGYVIREEEVIDVSSFNGNRQIVISDANRVSKNSTIVSYVSNDDDNIKNKITELDTEIQQIMETQQTVYSADVKSIENDIQKEIYEILNVKNDIYEIVQLKKNITKNLEKKANIVGELSPTGSKLNSLIEERMDYEKKLNDSKKDLKSEKAGLISYRIDGYENILTPNSFSKLTVQDLEKIKIGVNQVVPIDEQKVKMINNFYSYLAIVTDSEESKNLKLNDSVKISFNGDFNNYDKATVEYISDEEDERLIILKTTNNIEMLTQYRKLSFDIIWWNYEGLKVPNNSIYEKQIVNPTTGEVYATLKAVKLEEANYQKEVWVKVEKFVEDFAIIENYEDDELISLGIPEDIVDERYEISMYDEVVLN